MLTAGPLLLLIPFTMWPQQNEVGGAAVEILAGEDRTKLVMLMAVASLGVAIMFGGLHLLIKGMMEKRDGGGIKQLLSFANLLVITALVTFFAGFGGNVQSINALDTDINAEGETNGDIYANEADRAESARNAYDAASAGWTMLPIAWGLAMITIGLTTYLIQRPESPIDYMFTALIPVGAAFTLLPILNDTALFQLLFPVTLIIHILIGGLMLSGNLKVPDSN